MTRFALCALLVLVAACSFRVPGTYLVTRPLDGEKLELREDGTFAYQRWDDMGVFFEAEGTWERLSDGHVATQITRVLKGETGPQSPLRPHETWTVSARSIVRNTTPLRRQP